jgi:membrane fusion protein, multidrug efflux system
MFQSEYSFDGECMSSESPIPAETKGPATPPRPPGVSPGVRKGLLIAGGVILAAGLAYGIYWLVHGRYIVSTDDAYLRADAVTVAPRVSGYIDEIYVKENQHVAAGQPLLHIDKRNYQDTVSQETASVAAREADVSAADSQIRRQREVIAQSREELASARAKAQFSHAQAARYRALRDEGADTEEKSAEAESESRQNDAAEAAASASLRAAESQLDILASQRAQALAQLESAKASVSTARQNLDDTLLRASLDGTVGDDSARLGQYVQPGTRLMSLVPVRSVYLVANFKETQLTHMRIGQKASVEVDALGGAKIDAQVESFAPGTGSQFALLPPENATGNFIKIVQRVPVRLRLMPPEDLADRLIPGLSVTVRVDTTRDPGPGR